MDTVLSNNTKNVSLRWYYVFNTATIFDKFTCNNERTGFSLTNLEYKAKICKTLFCINCNSFIFIFYLWWVILTVGNIFAFMLTVNAYKEYL